MAFEPYGPRSSWVSKITSGWSEVCSEGVGGAGWINASNSGSASHLRAQQCIADAMKNAIRKVVKIDLISFSWIVDCGF